MAVTFEAAGRLCPLSDDEAMQLAARLEERAGSNGLHPAAIVAARIRYGLDAPTDERQGRLLDSENAELAWVVHEWLQDVGIDELPAGIVRLRDALDLEGRVTVEVPSGGVVHGYPLQRSVAIDLAQQLFLAAARGETSDAGETPRRVARRLEAALTGQLEGSVQLESAHEICAVRSALDSGATSRGRPHSGELNSLHGKVRELCRVLP